VPPLFELFERQAMAFGGGGEIREVMHEGLNLGGLLITLEIGLCALILAERMQLADEQAAARNQRSKRL
jgi:hypothetical protein